MCDVITCILAYKLTSKSESQAFEWSEKELAKDKSGTFDKTQVLGDGSSELIGGLSKEEIEISNSDISKHEYILDILENYLTLAVKE